MATHSSVLAWRIPWTEKPAAYSPWGCRELKVKEESEKVGLKLNIQKIKIMATRTYCIAQGAIFSIS